MPGRILIVDDVATNRIVLKVKLASAYYDVIQAEDGAEALELARAEQPDLIMLDIMMPDMDGVTVCERLKDDPLTADIPVIMVTSLSDTDAKMRALRAGADEFLTKPLDEAILLARVRSLLRARDTAEELRLRDSTCRELGFAEAPAKFAPAVNVALIAASCEISTGWKAMLNETLPYTLEVVAKENALARINAPNPPEVFVISVDLARPDDGLRLLSELRSRPPTRNAAIIMVLSPENRDSTAVALDLGANDLVSNTLDPDEMALRLRTQIVRKQQADRLRSTVRDGLRMAVTDPLTGLYNRRYALPHLARISDRSAQTGRGFAVMLLDLDRFKSINDEFGHAAGDAVLTEVAQRISGNMRGVDLVARIGGEEFLVAMPDTTLDRARSAAERLCAVIKATPVKLPDGRNITTTLSIGVAMGGGENQLKDKSIEQMMDLADQALYAAKAHGRNQVTFSRSAA